MQIAIYYTTEKCTKNYKIILGFAVLAIKRGFYTPCRFIILICIVNLGGFLVVLGLPAIVGIMRADFVGQDKIFGITLMCNVTFGFRSDGIILG